MNVIRTNEDYNLCELVISKFSAAKKAPRLYAAQTWVSIWEKLLVN